MVGNLAESKPDVGLLFAEKGRKFRESKLAFLATVLNPGSNVQVHGAYPEPNPKP